MPRFDEIGMLLHLKEKLMGHPNLTAITAHVDAALANHAAEATHEELPEVAPTKQQEEATAAVEEARAAQEEAAAKAKAEEERAAAEAEKLVFSPKAPPPDATIVERKI